MSEEGPPNASTGTREGDVDGKWEAIFSKHGDAITEDLRQYVVALGVGSGIIGSGLLVRHGERFFVFTVGHVVDECRRPLESGELALIARIKHGELKLRPTTMLLSRYEPKSDSYVDAGVVVLDRRDADVVSAYANNAWYTLPDTVTVRSPASVVESHRIFFAMGVVPALSGDPRVLSMNRVAHALSVVAFKRHPDLTHQGAIKFEAGPEWFPGTGRDFEGNVIEPDDDAAGIGAVRLSGLSGASVWTFDVDASGRRVDLILIAAHSASSSEALIGVPLSQNLNLLVDHGLLRRS